jgi:hypothetical protein
MKPFENESRALGDVNISDFHFFFKSRLFLNDEKNHNKKIVENFTNKLKNRIPPFFLKTTYKLYIRTLTTHS